MNWSDAARAVRWNVRPFIGGDYIHPKSSESFEKFNPADESVLYYAPVGDQLEVDQSVQVARQRFEDGCWAGLAPARRAEIIRRLSELIRNNKVELALMDCLEMGRPIRAALDDVENTATRIAHAYANLADKLLGQSAPIDRDAMSFSAYEPRGVVGAITPWNFPTVCAVIKIAPALTAGNTLILKPSEVAPSSALKIAELAIQAGVPEGVLNVLPGLGSRVGAALAMHRDVDLISFTGSTTTGRRIMELAGHSNGKPLLLECGGKSPQVVFDDVTDLAYVAAATAQSILHNQGQICVAHSRLLVHERIKDALLEQVIEIISRSGPGNPLDETTTFGPLASPAQRDRVLAYVDDGVASGARAVLKGRIQLTGGCYVAPTVFDRVTSTMKIAKEEIFGPVLCVQSFQTEPEAQALANNTEYGLAATIWTRDLGRARRMARGIRAGSVNVRTSGKEPAEAVSVLSSEPRGASGFGAERGLCGLLSYSAQKLVTFRGA